MQAGAVNRPGLQDRLDGGRVDLAGTDAPEIGLAEIVKGEQFLVTAELHHQIARAG